MISRAPRRPRDSPRRALVLQYGRPMVPPSRYSELASDRSGISTMSAAGGAEPRRVARLTNFHWLVGWNKSGTLAYGMIEDVAADGITRSSILTIDHGTTRRVVGPADTWGGRLSPDGRWLAYYSLDSGNFEIYVTPFPNTGARQLIAEGTDPSWSPKGSEIFYRNGGRLMAARLEMSAGIRVALPATGAGAVYAAALRRLRHSPRRPDAGDR